MLSLLLSGLVASAPAPDLGRAAQDWAVANGFGALEPRERFSTWFGTSVHLIQKIDGIPVHDGKLVVTFDTAGKVLLHSSSVVRFRKAITTPILTAEVALARASAQIPQARVGPAGPYGGVRRELFEVGGDLHLGYLVFVPTFDASESWHVVIDATTGDTLSITNRVLRASVDANVYATSPGGLSMGIGVAPLTAVRLELLDGGPMLVPNPGDFLVGKHISAFNCCVNEGCRADAGPKTVTNLTFRPDGGFFTDASVPLTAEVCDRMHRATSNPATHPSGNFVYPPFDSPRKDGGNPFGPAVQSDPSNSDEFAEVHAFFHVNRMYEWIEGLSGSAQPFKLRDARRTPALPMLVQANYIGPGLYRQDNAFFVPRETYEQVLLPDLFPDSDALFFNQGSYADFGYDATIIRHEFGHAVIMSTAALAFGTVVVGKHGASDERGTMHEGIADYLSAAFTNEPELGPYISPRQPASDLSVDRSVVNTLSCPASIWGESHRDSQPLAAALWTARKHFAGANAGRTFDAVVYAALVAMSPKTDADSAAEILGTIAAAAFPQVLDARTRMLGFLAANGAAFCARIIELTPGSAPRPYYLLAGGNNTGLAKTSIVPGPAQFKLRLPPGSPRFVVSASNLGSLMPVIAKLGAPIVFGIDGGVVTHDGKTSAPFRFEQDGGFTASLLMPAVCGQAEDVYFTLVNSSQNPGFVKSLNARAVIDPGCRAPTIIRALPEDYALASTGCGCTAMEGPFALLLLLLLGARRRTMR